MPTRNIVKSYGADTYYHVYNRGVDKQDIFQSPEDYWMLLSLFKRCLEPGANYDKYNREITSYVGEIELIQFCFMTNHYHLLVLNLEPKGIEGLMRSVMTAYSMYYNKKYRRVGSLFQNHYLASRITSDEYLWQVSRYIHLNPVDMGGDAIQYDYSSIQYFLGNKSGAWIHPERLVEPKDRKVYEKFVRESVDMYQEYKELRHELASV